MQTAVLINSLEFAKQSLEIHDKIRASSLPRLQEMLFSGSGEIEYRLLGGRDVHGKSLLRLVVDGQLGMICQRCLGQVEYPLSIDRHFDLVMNESALPELDADDEVDCLVADPKLDVVALVEEEILLALPMAVRHQDDCAVSGHGLIKKPNPFGVLQGLKTGDRN